MSKLIRVNGEEWVHKETGEIYTQQDLTDLNNKKMLEQNTEYHKNIVEHDLEYDYKIVPVGKKESNKKSVKERHNFNMIHRTDLKEIMLSGKLGEKECAFIGRLTPFICFPDNDIKIQNEYLTIEQIAN